VPLSTDPDDLIPFSLTLDEQRPEATRPVFLLRFLSVRQLLKARRLYDEFVAETDGDRENAKLNELLALGVGGWRNIPADFDAAKPGEALDAKDVLTAGEKAELARGVMNKPLLTESDRKNSARLVSSPADTSASAALQPSAETSQLPDAGTPSPAPPATGPAAQAAPAAA
jgi:hypothetical protein